MDDAPALVIRVCLCPGLRRRVSPGDVWHLIPFELYEVSVCLEEQPALVVYHRQKDFNLLHSTLCANGVKVRSLPKSRACHKTEGSKLQAYLRDLLQSHLGPTSFSLKAFFSGCRLSAVLQPPCVCGFPRADSFDGLREGAVLKRSHHAFPQFAQWVRVWNLAPHLREQLVARKEEQDLRRGRYVRRGMRRQEIYEELESFACEPGRHTDPETAQAELLQLDAVSQKLQGLRDQAQLDRDASATTAGPFEGNPEDQDFGFALPVRCEIEALAHVESRRYSEELDAVRVLEIRATQEVFSRIIYELLEDSVVHRRAIKRVENSLSLPERMDLLKEASQTRMQLLKDALESAKASLQAQKDYPGLGQPASNVKFHKSEFQEDEELHARCLANVREAQAGADDVARAVRQDRETAEASHNSWKSTEEILNWPVNASPCNSPRAGKSFSRCFDPAAASPCSTPRGRSSTGSLKETFDFTSSSEAAARRHAALQNLFQTEVHHSMRQNETHAEDLCHELRGMLDLLLEMGQQLRAEADVRTEVKAVLQAHTELRQRKLEMLQSEIEDAQRQVEARTDAFARYNRECVLPGEARGAELVDDHQRDVSTLEQVEASCQISVGVDDCVEMIMHGHMPERPEKIFPKPLKVCGQDVLDHVPHHLVRKYERDINRAIACDNIELDCQQAALALLEQLRPSEERQKKAKVALPAMEKLKSEIQSEVAELREWNSRFSFEEYRGEKLNLLEGDPTLQNAADTLKVMRSSSHHLLETVEQALANVENLVSMLSNHIDKEIDLRDRGQELFKKLCEKQREAVEARYKLASSLENVERQKETSRQRHLIQDRLNMEEENMILDHEHRRENMQKKHEVAMKQQREVAEAQLKEIVMIMNMRKEMLSKHRVGQKLQLPPVILDVTKDVEDFRR